MRVLVTGATGVYGRSVVERLHRASHEVVARACKHIAIAVRDGHAIEVTVGAGLPWPVLCQASAHAANAFEERAIG